MAFSFFHILLEQSHGDVLLYHNQFAVLCTNFNCLVSTHNQVRFLLVLKKTLALTDIIDFH